MNAKVAILIGLVATVLVGQAIDHTRLHFREPDPKTIPVSEVQSKLREVGVRAKVDRLAYANLDTNTYIFWVKLQFPENRNGIHGDNLPLPKTVGNNQKLIYGKVKCEQFLKGQELISVIMAPSEDLFELQDSLLVTRTGAILGMPPQNPGGVRG